MYQVYNTYTGEVYGKFTTEEEAGDMAWLIEDELRNDGMPFWDCIDIRDLNPKSEDDQDQ